LTLRFCRITLCVMFESGKKGNAAKKAYEIAYALFRISAKILEPSVRGGLESRAIDLLVAANTEAFDDAAKEIAAIEALVKFAIDLNIVSIANGDVLLREIAALNEIVIERLDRSDDVDVSRFFSKNKDSIVKDVVSMSASATPSGDRLRFPRAAIAASGIPHEKEPTRERLDHDVPVSAVNVISSPLVFHEDERSASHETKGRIGRNISSESALAEESKSATEIAEIPQSGNPAIALRSGNRQISILDKIRQSGNCKLREIQEILPDCSERTIRYDLEELIERNLVERIGGGGPAVFYRIRQTV
jgi:DeoR-like helix-turn-helix domain